MKVLLDHSIKTNSTRMKWGKYPIDGPDGNLLATPLIMAERRKLRTPAERERDAEAILTIGTLARKGEILLYTCSELSWEAMRDYVGSKPLDALRGCEVKMVPDAITRSNFHRASLSDFILKGGKKDGGIKEARSSQIAFFSWLTELTSRDVDAILGRRHLINLTDFECDSFRQLGEFQTIAKRVRSLENLPDAFNIWSADRNSLDCFLTLDYRIVNQFEALKHKNSCVSMSVEVISPIGLLNMLGQQISPYPCEVGRRYSMAEISRLEQSMGNPE